MGRHPTPSHLVGNVLSLYWPTTMTDDITWEAAVIEVTRPLDGGQPASALDLKVYGTTGNETRYDNDPTLEEVVGWAAYAVEKFFDEPLVSRASCADGALRFDAWDLVKLNDAYETDFDILDAAGVAIQTGSFSMEAMWRTSTVRVDLDAPESAASVVVHSVWGVSSTPLAFTCAR